MVEDDDDENEEDDNVKDDDDVEGTLHILCDIESFALTLTLLWKLGAFVVVSIFFNLLRMSLV